MMDIMLKVCCRFDYIQMVFREAFYIVAQMVIQWYNEFGT